MIVNNRANKDGVKFEAMLADIACDYFDGEVQIVAGDGEVGLRPCYLQIAAVDPLHGTGEIVRGRKWMVSKHATHDEVRQTAFMAILAFIEHELRESFTYKGVAILGPHLSHDALVDMHTLDNAVSVRP